jgi:deoxyhypusine synthase
MIKKMGLRINNKESIYYWAAVNDIPVFCPALTGFVLINFRWGYRRYVIC